MGDGVSPGEKNVMAFKPRVRHQSPDRCVSLAMSICIRGTCVELPLQTSRACGGSHRRIKLLLAMAGFIRDIVNAPSHAYNAEKKDLAQLIADAVKNTFGAIVKHSLSGALAVVGGVGGILQSLKDPLVIVPKSPLYWLVDGASILNLPAEGDPNDRGEANGSPKLTRTQTLFAWTAARLTELWQWVYSNGATFAGAVYTVFNALPIVQVTPRPAERCIAISCCCYAATVIWQRCCSANLQCWQR